MHHVLLHHGVYNNEVSKFGLIQRVFHRNWIQIVQIYRGTYFDFICFAAGILLPKLSRSTFLCDGAVAEEEQLSTALALAAGAFSGSTASGMQVVALLGELDEILIVVLPLRSEASCGAASCRSEWA